jgi:hypothetical protein
MGRASTPENAGLVFRNSGHRRSGDFEGKIQERAKWGPPHVKKIPAVLDKGNSARGGSVYRDQTIGKDDVHNKVGTHRWIITYDLSQIPTLLLLDMLSFRRIVVNKMDCCKQNGLL